MDEQSNIDIKDFFNNPDKHKILHPFELVTLFKKYAPHAVTQQEARLIFKELSEYLTEEEEHKLFVSWEELHYENKVDKFYGVIHDLFDKFSPT